MARKKDKLEQIAKVYDPDYKLVGDIFIWTVSNTFVYESKDKKTKLEADTVNELTDNKFKGKVRWIQISWKRNKDFNLSDHVQKYTDKSLHWSAS
jgi:exopolysaccharide biosynthesis predicted pyruvyltransferase EpsI